jgi:hypothetical protein
MSLEHSPARSRKAAAAVVDPTYTVDSFCAAEAISRAQLYRAWREGWGPDYYLNGVERRITTAARMRWQAQREAAARAKAAGERE